MNSKPKAYHCLLETQIYTNVLYKLILKKQRRWRRFHQYGLLLVCSVQVPDNRRHGPEHRLRTANCNNGNLIGHRYWLTAATCKLQCVCNGSNSTASELLVFWERLFYSTRLPASLAYMALQAEK